MKYGFGYKPSDYDSRDYTLNTFGLRIPEAFPPGIPWDYSADKVKDQDGQTCGFNSQAEALEIMWERINGKYVRLSTNFLNAFRPGQKDKLPGISPRDVCITTYKHGCCEYDLLPGDMDWPEVKELIEGREEELLTNAAKYKTDAYLKVFTPEEVKTALIHFGPVLVGVPVYRGFSRINKYNYVLESSYPESLLSGWHMMTILWWTDDDKWIVLNHYDKTWGLDGKCLMPFDYPIKELWVNAIEGPQKGDYMDIQRQYITMNRSLEVLAPKGQVIHSTATPGATAQNEFTMPPFEQGDDAEIKYGYFNTGERFASAHTFIDWNQILEVLPLNERAWHAGPSANKLYLGIELCEPKDNDPNRFSKFQEVWKRAVWYAAKNCVEYGWEQKPNELGSYTLSHNIISSRYPDETDHTDPYPFFKKYGKTWANFITEVCKEIDRQKGVNPMEVAVVYWSLRDFSSMFMVANKLGSCGTFCRNEIANNIHPDAMKAKKLINIGGPEVTNHPNVKNLCGKGAPETAILVADFVKTL